MADVTYQVVEHDGGWAYKLGDVFSETFPSHEAARAAADRVAAEQRIPGETAPIRFQDAKGQWHDETARGSDRPSTDVVG
ncbi:DUF2188 domain-containing protein [Enterovirga sp.]|jgi:hypothetical protein|uniref:DUF2188 domain-containing protein n=1 Tax=Enterovirga sp. TaxID=2026350 RepID=UPI00263747CA|nr:DUF2188 domain-containing protein [Enterovirga sp.]MDB5592795.1 hypothetical protein [Enterovirga sp.]